MFPSHPNCLRLCDAFQSSALTPVCLIYEAKGFALGLHQRIVLKEGR